MTRTGKPIQILTAPSILGLKPTGVETLPETLLRGGLAAKLDATSGVRHVPVLNHRYETSRDPDTKCLNPHSIVEFSQSLGAAVTDTVKKDHFALVLGGDCSILIGILPGLKARGETGLIFLDGHADFYEPDKSTTGEVADMDLAIVTGRGPDLLTNINGMKPYVNDENVIHIGQRDQDEAKKFHSQDIRQSGIKCFSFAEVHSEGVELIIQEVRDQLDKIEAKACWIHFDTDVLSDAANPAVDYRLPGGLDFSEVRMLISGLLETDRITGMSVTIFNPRLDPTGQVGANIVDCIAGAMR